MSNAHVLLQQTSRNPFCNGTFCFKSFRAASMIVSVSQALGLLISPPLKDKQMVLDPRFVCHFPVILGVYSSMSMTSTGEHFLKICWRCFSISCFAVFCTQLAGWWVFQDESFFGLDVEMVDDSFFGLDGDLVDDGFFGLDGRWLTTGDGATGTSGKILERTPLRKYGNLW